ncbi:MAG: MmcQ/YjbR family DNA-binding protein [Paramuribaculum sp.]|nr:MmcQ/YjbR family DNA-binding protein [Paramuribaculum sp.]
MDIENFRDMCLKLGNVTEKTPFGKFAKRYESILVFYVAGHMFCFIDMNDFTFVNVRLTPDEIDDFRLKYDSVSRPINQSLKYWIQLNFGGDIPDDIIKKAVKRAYEVVVQKYSGK